MLFFTSQVLHMLFLLLGIYIFIYLSFSFKLDITFPRYALVTHFNACIPPSELSKYLLLIIIICQVCFLLFTHQTELCKSRDCFVSHFTSTIKD